MDSATTLVHAFVSSRVDDCSILLAGAPKVVNDRLQRVLNAAARVLSSTHKYSTTESFIGSMCRKEFSTNSAALCTVACRPITAVPRRSLCPCRTSQQAASSIGYSVSLGGSAMPAQHTRSTGLLCGRPVALKLSTRQLERSGSWQGQFQTSVEDASIFTVLKHLAY